MQIKPVPKADKPEYPTASEIDIPEVLNASKPNKWKRNAAIGAVMVGMALNLNSCIYTDVGSHGCIAVSPPVYLSESEVKDIILNELEENDIHFTENNDTTKGVTLTLDISYRNNFYNDIRYSKDSSSTTRIIPFDMFLDSNNFAIIFVSKYKYDRYSCINYPYIYLNKLATIIQKEGEKQNKSLVVFYVPAVQITQRDYWFWEESNESIVKRISIDRLRKQVRDFLAWYKENKGKK